MNLKVWCLVIVIALSGMLLAGCTSTTGVFARTEERAVNLGESITNIALDGDGIN